MSNRPFQAGLFIPKTTTDSTETSLNDFGDPFKPHVSHVSSLTHGETEEVSESNSNCLEHHESGKPSPLVIVLTILASVSGFMFGYDTGYISSALVVIGDDLGHKLSYGNKEFITSATSCGALIASLFAGLAADIVGRKPVIMFSNILFIIGASLQCASHGLWLMIAGRFIMGFGVGIGSLIAPLYISELAPSKYRGRLVLINALAITFGQLIAYSIGAGLTKVFNGWRILVGISMIPPAIQMVIFFFMPDTPRFLIMKNRLPQAEAVLQRVYKNADSTLIELRVRELNQINGETEGDISPFVRTWHAIKEIHTVPSNFRALIIGCGLQGIQQFTGWNAMMYFSLTIFESIGFDNSTAVAIIIAGTNFFWSVVAFFIIDRVGRRRILLIGLPIMVVSLAICAISFHFLGMKFEDGESVMPDGQEGISTWGIMIIVFIVVFASGYAVGLGNVPWQQSELFPQKVRGVGTSLLTLTNWTGSLIISSTFLTMLENITPMGTFILFTVLALISFFAIYFCYPELSGLELEEVQEVLTGGFNIKKSLEMSKLRREEPSQDLGAFKKTQSLDSSSVFSNCKPTSEHV